MPQIIDLRKKAAPLEVPQPPVESAPIAPAVPEPVVAEPVVFTDSDASDIRWTAHVARPPHKKRTLYLVIGLSVIAILVALISHDYLFTIVLILSGLVLMLNAHRPHHPSEIRVHATGVAVDDQRHHFADIKSFWIDYQPHIKEVSIEFKKGYQPHMRIPLEDADPLEVRRAMLAYVPEREHEQSLFDHIVRLMGI